MSSEPFPAVARRPEVLAPAGDWDSLRAAVRAGADAVYFGLNELNARARATNFQSSELPELMAELHRHEVKGYVALNTLVFDSELALLDRSLLACAAAGVDAVILQDLGAVRRARELVPELAVHASTQMTCTDAGSVELARALGARRVVLARELSLSEISAIARATSTELEVFVHGALCVAYSGQCLTSEAIGGRSANRGACAQACRLPYELYVDGVQRDLGERAYLLSPEDLESSALVPELAAAGVVSLKIEGRLKGAEYVAAVTALYRRAVDALADGEPPSERMRRRALQTFTRGSGPGFLRGVDHQRLVEARSSDHRGLLVGEASGSVLRGGRSWIAIALSSALQRGDGILVEGRPVPATPGGRAGTGLSSEGEVGGRVWAIERSGVDVPSAQAGERVSVWLGPDVALGLPRTNAFPRRVFLSQDPRAEAEIQRDLMQTPARVRLDFWVRARVGEPLALRVQSARGRTATWRAERAVERARAAATTRAVMADKLSRLGDSPYEFGELTLELDADAFIPVSELNHARRELVSQLAAQTAPALLRAVDAAPMPSLDRAAPPAGLFALCRNLEQARAALSAGVDGVYLDFLELTGTGQAFRTLREEFPSAHLGVTPPRIRKPGEEKIDRFLAGLAPDSLLVRGLGALGELRASPGVGPLRIGDFSLNVASRLSAEEVLRCGVHAFTPAFDLDSSQLTALLDGELAPFAEVVIHHPMPLFHMEHCVYAALLSSGSDYKTCGRPCEQHQIELRDRSGRTHPVIADVGCRNTVFHGQAQSAAALLPQLQRSGVRRFRIELLRENAGEAERTVSAYRALLSGAHKPQDVWKRLRAESGYGVVRGSLRVVS